MVNGLKQGAADAQSRAGPCSQPSRNWEVMSTEESRQDQQQFPEEPRGIVRVLACL